MSESELNELCEYCKENDLEAQQLLNNYLQWRFNQKQEQQGATTSSAALTKTEALEILGLDDDASEDDIIKAHRRLIQKLHPDRGGSDYLAAKINQAKDLLINS